MNREENIKRLGLQSRKSDEEIKSKKNNREVADFGGRKLIILIFLMSILLSILFWLQGNLVDWYKDFFGPSKWSFSR